MDDRDGPAATCGHNGLTDDHNGPHPLDHSVIIYWDRPYGMIPPTSIRRDPSGEVSAYIQTDGVSAQMCHDDMQMLTP